MNWHAFFPTLYEPGGVNRWYFKPGLLNRTELYIALIIYGHIWLQGLKKSELGTLELCISGLILNPLFLLI